MSHHLLHQSMAQHRVARLHREQELARQHSDDLKPAKAHTDPQPVEKAETKASKSHKNWRLKFARALSGHVRDENSAKQSRWMQFVLSQATMKGPRVPMGRF